MVSLKKQVAIHLRDLKLKTRPIVKLEQYELSSEEASKFMYNVFIHINKGEFLDAGCGSGMLTLATLPFKTFLTSVTGIAILLKFLSDPILEVVPITKSTSLIASSNVFTILQFCKISAAWEENFIAISPKLSGLTI